VTIVRWLCVTNAGTEKKKTTTSLQHGTAKTQYKGLESCPGAKTSKNTRKTTHRLGTYSFLFQRFCRCTGTTVYSVELVYLIIISTILFFHVFHGIEGLCYSLCSLLPDDLFRGRFLVWVRLVWPVGTGGVWLRALASSLT
jgi:hypothetical protein